MRYRLLDLADVIRSKNSGPFELTFDIIFKEREMYENIRKAQVFTPQKIAGLYQIAPESVLGIIDFDPAKAVKVNIRRPVPSGNLGDTDIYGAQQHGPLLNFEFDL